MEAFQSLWCPKKVLPVSFSLLPSGRGTSKAMSCGTARLERSSCKKHHLISHQLLSVLAGISRCLSKAIQETAAVNQAWAVRNTITNSASKERKYNIAAKLRMVLAAAATWIFKKRGDKNKQKPNPYQKLRNKLVSSFSYSMLLSPFCNIFSVSCRLNMSLFILFLLICGIGIEYKHHWITCLCACMCNITIALKFCFLLR